MSLNIVITADPQAAVAGLKKVETQLEQTGVAARKVIPQISVLGRTLEDLNQKIRGKTALLSTETDVAKIKILRAEIQLLQREALRVGNIGKVGFDQLGNAIQRVPPQLAAVGGGLTRTLGGLRTIAHILPSVGIGGLIGALTGLVAGLFQTGQAFSGTEIFAAKFSNALKDIGRSADELKGKLDFENKIAGLKAQLAGLTGEDLSIFKLELDVQSSQKIKDKADKDITNLERVKKGFDGLAKSVRESGVVLNEFGVKDKLATLLATFPDVSEIPEGLISKLNEKEQAGLNAYKGTLKELEGAKERSKVAGQVIDAATIQIGIEKNSKFKKVLDQGKGDYEKYVGDMISLANQIKFVPFFGEFEENIFATRQQNFEKANALVDAFYKSLSDTAKTKFGEPIKLPGASFEFGPTKDIVGQPVQKLFKDPVIIPIEFRFDPIDPNKALRLEQIEKDFNSIFEGIAESSFDAFGQSLGNALSGKADALSPIIELFSALLTEIGKALIKFGVVKMGLDKILGPGGILIPGGVAIALGVFAIAAGSLLKSFNAPGRATGGAVAGGMPYLVGERRPELFIPSTSGKIIDQPGLGSVSGKAMQNIHITGEIKGQGKDLVLVFNRELRFQNSVS